MLWLRINKHDQYLELYNSKEDCYNNTAEPRDWIDFEEGATVEPATTRSAVNRFRIWGDETLLHAVCARPWRREDGGASRAAFGGGGASDGASDELALRKACSRTCTL